MFTFPDHRTQSQNLANDNSSTAQTFLDKWANHYYKEILADLGRPLSEKTKTASSVQDQQEYQVPPDCLRIKTITYTSGSVAYTLEEIEDQDTWNRLNVQSLSGIPRYFFARPRFGIQGEEFLLYPKPSSSTDTITLVFESGDKDLSAAAYTTGTVTMTAGSATVTGSGTTFTAGMVGRYIKSTGALSDGFWYRINTFTSTTVLLLENVYEGATEAGAAYTLEEIWNLPEEMQVLPTYGSLAAYYGMKQNVEQEGKFLGLYTAGLEKAKVRYGTKTRSNIIRNKQGLGRTRRGGYPDNFPESIS